MYLPPADTLPSDTPPRGPSRRTLMLLIGGGVAGVLALLVGVAAVAWTLLASRPNSLPQLLAADTQIYAAITPNLSDLPNIDRLRRAFPEALDPQNSASTGDQLKESLGITIKDDVLPWIGPEMAVGISGLPFDTMLNPGRLSQDSSGEVLAQAHVTVVLTSRDEKAARAFLDKQRAHREGKGATFTTSEVKGATIYAEQGGAPGPNDPGPLSAFAIVRGNVVFATSPDLIAAMAARDPAGKETLAANARFQQVLALLPAERLGFIFIDGGPIAQAMRANSDQLVGQLKGAAADRARDQLASVDALQGVGLSLGVLADGVAFDALVSFDRAGLSQATLAQIKEASDPVSAERVGRISADALAAMSFRLPASFGKQLREGLASVPGFDDQVAQMEQQFDLDLDRDLLSWLQGEATVALLPGEELMGQAAPVTGYLALKSNDRAAAEAGIKRIVAAVDKASGGQLGLHEEQLGGVAWQVFGPQQQTVGGYGFVGDDLVIGVGPSALTAAAKPAAPLSGDAAYQASLKALPTPNGGQIFVNLPAVIRLAKDQGSLNDPTVADRLKPFKTIMAAGAPGIDEKGVARGRLYLVIAGE